MFQSGINSVLDHIGSLGQTLNVQDETTRQDRSSNNGSKAGDAAKLRNDWLAKQRQQLLDNESVYDLVDASGLRQSWPIRPASRAAPESLRVGQDRPA